MFPLIIHSFILPIRYSYLVLQLSEAQRSVQILLPALEPMSLISLSSWTRAQLIAVQPIVDVRGQYAAGKLHAKLFFVEGGGKNLSMIIFIQKTHHYSCQVFSSSRDISRKWHTSLRHRRRRIRLPIVLYIHQPAPRSNASISGAKFSYRYGQLPDS